jgi:eukaryotic-like serine/threonine-protein kinase
VALTGGTRLGPYEIVAPLGAGGMGEVYRARDTKLDRDVAVKVLPPELASSTTALARFEREAKAVAALSHPNILSIYDFGAEGGTAFAVMELLEGETLRDSLGGIRDSGIGARMGGLAESQSPNPEARRGVPLRKAIDYAIQIARGLAAAHGRGIVHRDLKPENVFVTADGRVKILDFGLARETPAFAGADASVSPTIERHTDPGTVLGTVGYMSPEQVRGEPGDQRSDLFSFGAVLYELVSGRRAFQRNTAAETMTAILREDPPELSTMPAGGVSGLLARIILHCLEKNPAERFQNASDVAFALEALGTSSSSSTSEAPSIARSSPRRGLRRGLAVSALVAAVAVAAFVGGRATGRAPATVSFTPLTYQQQTIFRALFAPDGKTVVFSAALKAGTVELFTLTPEYPESRNLGLRDAHLLSVSSKNELAILTGARYISHRLFLGTLARMPIGGGAPREILENVREADWSPDGETLAIIREIDGRDRLEYPIGKVLYEASGYLSDPRVSPAGDRVAFFEHPVKYDDRGGVAIVDLAGKKTTLTGGYWGLEGSAWSQDGHELLFSGGLSYSQFKIFGVNPSGTVRQIVDSAGGLTFYDRAADGRWLAVRDDLGFVMMAKPPGATGEINVSWLDFSQTSRLSADGRVLLFTEQSGVVGNNYAVCLRKTDGSGVVRLGEGLAYDLSPDGKWALAVISGDPNQLMMYPTGPGQSRRLDRGPIQQYSSARWFADGRRILVCGSETARADRCYVQDVGGGTPRPVTPDDTHGGLVSPDGTSVLVRRGGGAARDAGHGAASSTVFEIYPIAGGAPRAVPGIQAGDVVVKWNNDGGSLTVANGLLAARVERLDLATGRRELIRTISGANIAGATNVAGLTLADDPNVYAYHVNQNLSRLFLVTGAR